MAKSAKILKFPEKKSVPFYKVLIQLKSVEPPVQRVILIQSDVSLYLFHAIIQISMGWTNSHVHQFLIGREVFSDPLFELNENRIGNAPFVEDESKVTLREAAPRAGMQFIYEYDFGDSWEHVIGIEDIEWRDDIKEFARIIEGKRGCPPEDCGGPHGYMHLIEIMNGPKNEEYHQTKEWLGKKLEPELFDMAKTNIALAKLQSRHPTIKQLADILLERE